MMRPAQQANDPFHAEVFSNGPSGRLKRDSRPNVSSYTKLSKLAFDNIRIRTFTEL
jgi:hypothetical protein